ncbi:hypothetical protein FB446DRAFT_714722 [Lentinula raphanica]|nr:hypothetical protein FB446DRAFT_714722 [Lentinula raphanica]
MTRDWAFWLCMDLPHISAQSFSSSSCQQATQQHSYNQYTGDQTMFLSRFAAYPTLSKPLQTGNEENFDSRLH